MAMICLLLFSNFLSISITRWIYRRRDPDWIGVSHTSSSSSCGSLAPSFLLPCCSCSLVHHIHLIKIQEQQQQRLTYQQMLVFRSRRTTTEVTVILILLTQWTRNGLKIINLKLLLLLVGFQTNFRICFIIYTGKRVRVSIYIMCIR